MDVTLKHPSAWVPLLFSGVALLVVLLSPVINLSGSVSVYLIRLWIILEIFLILFFALKWMPRKTHLAFRIMLVQVIGILVPIAFIFFLHL